MARTTVMKLWTAVVTAFLALCTTLGLITTTAAASVPRNEPARNTGATTALAPAPQTALPPKAWDRSLPPTMKQRIRAEAHGSSPSCRHRRPTDATASDDTACDTGEADASTAPLRGTPRRPRGPAGGRRPARPPPSPPAALRPPPRRHPQAPAPPAPPTTAQPREDPDHAGRGSSRSVFRPQQRGTPTASSRFEPVASSSSGRSWRP